MEMHELLDRNDVLCNHREPVTKMVYIPACDKYITCGRDSTFRVWNANDLKHMRTINNGSLWINDVAYLALQRKIVVVSMDRAISYYDVHRGAYELTGRYVGRYRKSSNNLTEESTHVLR